MKALSENIRIHCFMVKNISLICLSMHYQKYMNPFIFVFYLKFFSLQCVTFSPLSRETFFYFIYVLRKYILFFVFTLIRSCSFQFRDLSIYYDMHHIRSPVFALHTRMHNFFLFFYFVRVLEEPHNKKCIYQLIDKLSFYFYEVFTN